MLNKLRFLEKNRWILYFIFTTVRVNWTCAKKRMALQGIVYFGAARLFSFSLPPPRPAAPIPALSGTSPHPHHLSRRINLYLKLSKYTPLISGAEGVFSRARVHPKMCKAFGRFIPGVFLIFWWLEMSYNDIKVHITSNPGIFRWKSEYDKEWCSVLFAFNGFLLHIKNETYMKWKPKEQKITALKILFFRENNQARCQELLNLCPKPIDLHGRVVIMSLN